MSDARSTKQLIAEARRIAAGAPSFAPILNALADRLRQLDDHEDRFRKHGGSCAHKFVREYDNCCVECGAYVGSIFP